MALLLPCFLSNKHYTSLERPGNCQPPYYVVTTDNRKSVWSRLGLRLIKTQLDLNHVNLGDIDPMSFIYRPPPTCPGQSNLTQDSLRVSVFPSVAWRLSTSGMFSAPQLVFDLWLILRRRFLSVMRCTTHCTVRKQVRCTISHCRLLVGSVEGILGWSQSETKRRGHGRLCTAHQWSLPCHVDPVPEDILGDFPAFHPLDRQPAVYPHHGGSAASL